ncbi:hypothetical protein [Rhizobium etli]|uniref:Uncharacterized protein n=1 Tax=Rhizobium etli TaxID=29449 RepID=A0A7W6V4L9_RHIET|nr:hypothetical protein [Rhizobium etli]MBB4477501.1 hypothetical protein [Rhizobium etli]MBB4533333.1 hypothetical protein [Rhizobium etli]
MIYHEDKPSGTAFPLVVILIAMAAIVGSLALSSGHQTSPRVWIPGNSSTSGTL